MADIDTSFYPRAQQINPLQIYGEAAQYQNLLTQNQRQQVGLTADKVQLAHQGYQWMTEGLAAMASNPNLNRSMLEQFANQGIQGGWLTPQVAQAELANAPTDPAQLRQYVLNLGVRAQSAQGAFEANWGKPAIVSDGTTNNPVLIGGLNGPRPVGAPFLQTLTPGERAAGVPGVDAQNRPTITPMGTVLQRAGYNPLTAMPATAPAPSSTNQLQPYPQGQAPVSAGQGNSVPMGPPAGAVEAQTQAAKVSAEKYSTDAAAQTNYQQNILPIQQAYEHIKALGPTGVGPGTEEINQFKSFIQSMGLGPIAGIDPQTVSDFDQANKYTTAAMRANGFTGSDAQLDAAAKASPTMKTSQGAALAVLQKMAAMTRMQNAQVQAFQTSGQGPETYSKWASNWNTKQNAAAYAFDMMDQAQRQAYVKTLSPAELAKFKASLGTAMQLGLVTPPQSGSNGG